MDYPIYPESRLCLNCKMNRVPDTKVVKKDGKRWMILTCRVCKMKDIEPAGPPMKIFKGGYFIDDTELDENNDD